MASGAHHCKDCGLYFESAQSLKVHIQYHKENLLNMWMGSEDRAHDVVSPPEPSPVQSTNSDMSQVNSSDLQVSSGNVNSSNSNASFSAPSPSFMAPSPMQYDYKMSPSMHSPQSCLVSQGPSSGHGGSAGYAQQPSIGYYLDYQSQPMQTQYSNYQPNFMNGGTYEDQYYGRSGATTPRFHPYVGRSPLPTPSPGTVQHMEVKDEPRSSANTPEILDLDSQKVLGPHGQPNQQSSVPPMWRPHEQYPTTSGLASSGGISPNIGNIRSPTGMSPSGGMLQMPTGLAAAGPAAPLSVFSTLNQPGFGPPTSLRGSAGHIGTLSSTGFSGGSSYMNTGMGISASVKPSTNQFTVAPVTSPTHEGPPSDYPSNVKRVKSFKCNDCNKWFTSQGHLKRHYNTTLHKNMMKANNSESGNQSSTPDITRPPILSPGTKSIGETSTSSHDDESNLSANDAMDSTPPTPFQAPMSAFQPPLSSSVVGFPTQGTLPQSASQPLHNIPPSIPPYNQPHSFSSDHQSLTASTMYHGHFSTNSSFPPQPPVTVSNGAFFPTHNSSMYQQPGGLQGPGYHSMNEYSGPNTTTTHSFSSFKSESGENVSSHSAITENCVLPSTSPDPMYGDTGSEASMDSSESVGGSTNPDSYRCKDCSKTFNRMCYLTQHRMTYHDGEKPFKCTTCGKRFTDEVTFTDHQSKHAGEKPYKCEVCPKQFNHKTDLRRHMCLHTGEKPFSCEQCGKGFIRKDHMLKHFQTHRKKAMSSSSSSTNSHPTYPAPFGASHGSVHSQRNHPPPVVAPPVF